MNCAFHGQNLAVVNCNGCGKPLCPACDHRVKGFPFCQECIVSGVELLRNQTRATYVPIIKRQTSPLMATILSFVCPGLGAAYNGQTSKALIYFAVFVGFFQMAILTGGMTIFVLGFIGMWLFAALDSWRTAQILRSGVAPSDAEDIIVQRFSGSPKLWGAVLIVLGTSFFLQSFFNFRILTKAVLPVLLIGLGIYLLRDYVFKPGENQQKPNVYANLSDVPTFAGATGDLDFSNENNENFDRQNDFETQTRVRTWKNR